MNAPYYVVIGHFDGADDETYVIQTDTPDAAAAAAERQARDEENEQDEQDLDWYLTALIGCGSERPTVYSDADAYYPNGRS